MRPPGRPYLLPAPVHPNKRPDQRLHIPQRSRLPAADRPDFNVLQTNYRSATGTGTASRAAQGGQPAALQERRGRRRLRHARIVRRLSRPRGHHRGVPDEERLLGTGGPDGALHLRRPHGDRRLRRKRGGQFPHRRRTTPGGADRKRHLGPETHPARTGESPAFAPKSPTA